ncbi:MAG: tetratricopeptide repeat protein [Deltaproteobacteria bacterium]|nr:MAG: tetratricopeptide repeat protein [Deltaproteobacteria bacterium]
MKIKSYTPEKEYHSQKNQNLQSSRAVFTGPLLYLFLAAVVFLLYSNTFQSPYIFDDWYHIEANPHIRVTSLNWDAIRQAAFDSPLDRRPVAYLTLALNYYFHGYELFGYHLVNILIHLGASIFLFMFLQTTLGLQQGKQNLKYGELLPFVAALIWLVHPLQVQSVTYIIQRMNSLAAMFYILSMLFYARGRLAKSSMQQAFLILGSVCSGVLALGSKENAATLPLFIMLYEWFFFQDLSVAWLRKRIIPILSAALIFVCIIVLFLGLHPLSYIADSYGSRDFTMLQRVLTEFRVVLFYVSLILFPYPGRLNIDHDFQLSQSLFDPMTTIMSLGVLLGLFSFALILARRERLFSFCILWFLGHLVIESSVLGLEIIFEHRTYLPSMLGIFAIVLLVNLLLRQKWLKLSVMTLVLILFSIWTYQRNMVWQDEVTLRRDAVEKSPAKPRAYAILANALERKHDYDEAALYYRKTLSLNPRNADEIHYNLGNVLMAQGKIDEAVDHFRKALSLNPDAAPIRLNLAYAFSLKGDNIAAFNELQELIRRHPEEPRAHNNLGILYMKQGRFKEAVFHFTEALTLQPNYKQARINLEAALLRLDEQKGRQ